MFKSSPAQYVLGRRAFNLALLGAMLGAALGSAAPRAFAAGEPPAPKAAPLRVLAFGDSLTAGYGLSPEEGFVSRLQAWMEAAAPGLVTLEDGGVAGDTSAGGLARLDWLLGDPPPDLAILQLGANDFLRGLPPKETEANLRAMLEILRDRGVTVLLAGMMAPRNMGPEYVEEFDAIYPKLAEEFGVALHPFFLEGVATVPELNQADGMHPNAKGVEIVVAGIAPELLTLAQALRAKKDAA